MYISKDFIVDKGLSTEITECVHSKGEFKQG